MTRLAVLLCAACASAGCLTPSAATTGDLRVRWEALHPFACDEIALSQVAVLAVASEEGILSGRIVPCDELEAELLALPPGSWTVRLEAYDGLGELDSVASARVEIRAGAQVEVGPLRWRDAGLGDVRMRFRFAGEERCEEARVARLELELVDSFGGLQRSLSLACDDAHVLTKDLPIGMYELTVVAVASDGAPLFEAHALIFVEGAATLELGTLDLEAVRPGRAVGL